MHPKPPEPVPVPVPGLLALTLVLTCACVPDLDSDESTVSEPRVIAIQAEPAEAAANEAVTYRALVVDDHGDHTGGGLFWNYCLAPKPLAELGPVSKKCLDPTSDAIQRIGKGVEVKAALPADACSLFGPNPPPPVDDEPPGRPVDPDDTGGYKQPVVLGFDPGVGEDVLLYEQRLFCGLAGANQAQAAEFTRRYRRNVNPSVDGLRVTHADGATETLKHGDVLEVKRSEVVTLEVTWPSCATKPRCGDGVCGIDESTMDCAEDCTTPTGCAGQETYLFFDTENRELVARREALRVAWFATGGTYDDERTGVAEDESARGSKNTWTAPSKAGAATLWFVIRDARDGVGFGETRVTVK